MPEARLNRVLVVEDDPIFREHLVTALTGWLPDITAHVAASGHDAIALARSVPPLDIALVDLGLPDMEGTALIHALHAQDPDLPILVVSVIAAERVVLGAIRAGASGYLLKGGSEAAIVQGIRDVLAGNYPLSPALARYLVRFARSASPQPKDPLPALTPRETETLRLISRGFSYDQTAVEMGVSLSTVQSNIRSLYRKLQVSSQAQAAEKARQAGLLE